MYSGLVIIKTKVVASSRFCTNPEMSVVLWISGRGGRWRGEVLEMVEGGKKGWWLDIKELRQNWDFCILRNNLRGEPGRRHSSFLAAMEGFPASMKLSNGKTCFFLLFCFCCYFWFCLYEMSIQCHVIGFNFLIENDDIIDNFGSFGSFFFYFLFLFFYVINFC